MGLKALRPFKWLKNMKKWGVKISGDRTEMIRTNKGRYIWRYKRDIRGHKKWK